jgi:hypothetical protein
MVSNHGSSSLSQRNDAPTAGGVVFDSSQRTSKRGFVLTPLPAVAVGDPESEYGRLSPAERLLAILRILQAIHNRYCQQGP